MIEICNRVVYKRNWTLNDGSSIASFVLMLLAVILGYQKFFVYHYNMIWLNLADDLIFFIWTFFIIFYKLKKKLIVPIYINYIFAFILFSIISFLINDIELDVLIVQLRSYILYSFMILILFNTYKCHYMILSNFDKLIYVFFPIIFLSIVEFFLQNPMVPLKYDFASKFFQNGQSYRIVSILGNPIDYGNVLGFIAIYFFHKFYNIDSRKYIFIFFIIALMLLLATGSRGPLIGFLLAIIVVSSLQNSLKILFVILFLLIFFGQALIYKTIFDFNYLNLEHNFRFIWLLDSIRVFVDNPMLGVGPGRFGGWVSVNYLYSEIYKIYGISTFGIATIDMFWPHLVVEMGIFGALIFVFPWFIYYQYFRNEIKKHKENLPIIKFYSKIGRSTIIFVAVISLFNSAYEIQLVQFLFFTFISLSAIGIKNINN